MSAAQECPLFSSQMVRPKECRMAQALQPVSQPTITERNRAIAADTARITRLGAPPTIRKGGGGVPLAESFLSSLHNLSANVTRTILTMLGIIIGVASVI